ncbi:MAG: HEAT repeat domain-containing protein, partial [Myxococcales bacterium]
IILGRVGGPEAVQALIAGLQDEEYPVRGACALALGTIGDLQAVEPLASMLDDTESFVREEAKRSLLRFARPEALPYLQVVRERGSPRVRLGLVDVLAQLKGSDGAPLLLELAADPEEAIRHRAGEKLAALDVATLTPVLRKGLEHPNYRVRAKSASLLGQKAVAETATRLADLAAAPTEPAEVQSAARGALKAMKGSLDPQRLAATARDGKAERTERIRSLVLLSATGGTDALEACLDVLNDPEEQLRGSAALALAELGNPRALPRLREAASRPDNARISRQLDGAIQKLERGW